jgi:cysteinyl-tRNA synthetase
MAKSAGNFQRITELAERGVEPLAFRYLTLTSRYARKLNFSDTSLDAAAAALTSLRARLAALGPPPAAGPWAAPPVLAAGAAGDRPAGEASAVGGFGGGEPYALRDRAHAPSAPLTPAGRALHDRFVAALDDDLDLPVATAVIRATLRSGLEPDEARWLVLDADAILGLDLHRVWDRPADGVDAATATPIAPEVAALVSARGEARAARDFARADAIRDELAAAGWDVVDGPDGPTLRPR